MSEYSILTQLGKGSYGRVVLAQHKNTKVRVAIKIIGKDVIMFNFNDPTEPFQEIKLLEELAPLKSVHLLKLIDKGEN